jgi:hypothetical protein
VTRYQEMHADGGIAAPLFLMPDALLRWRELGQRLRRGRVYVIFNTVLDPSPRTTPTGRDLDHGAQLRDHAAVLVSPGPERGGRLLRPPQPAALGRPRSRPASRTST